MPSKQIGRLSEAGGEMYRAGCPSPGTRLMQVVSLLQGGRPVADIGCDHGKLAVYLVMKNISPNVVAVDARPIPLSRARALAAQCGVEDSVDCRLGDGLAPLREGEAAEIVIAGLSGETIAGILERTDWLHRQKYHMVLQPATRAPELRRWLCENGFEILQEAPVMDRGKAYTTISAASQGDAVRPDGVFCEVGLLPQVGGPAAKRLLENRLADLHNRALAPMDTPELQALKTQIDEVAECLKLMK